MHYKDGRTKHPLYGLWKQMLYRCENSKAKHYNNYGGRGIQVCTEWHDFWNFVAWSDNIGGRPTNYTLDRIDNNGNYEPSNCRWANNHTQSNNKSSNTFINYNGVSKTITEWATELNMCPQTLFNRINRGWSVERAFSEKPSRNPHPNRNTPVICYNLDGTIYKTYDNLSSTPDNFSKKSISGCCCGSKKTYKGFIWKYAKNGY